MVRDAKQTRKIWDRIERQEETEESDSKQGGSASTKNAESQRLSESFHSQRSTDAGSHSDSGSRLEENRESTSPEGSKEGKQAQSGGVGDRDRDHDHDDDHDRDLDEANEFFENDSNTIKELLHLNSRHKSLLIQLEEERARRLTAETELAHVRGLLMKAGAERKVAVRAAVERERKAGHIRWSPPLLRALSLTLDDIDHLSDEDCQVSCKNLKVWPLLPGMFTRHPWLFRICSSRKWLP